MTLLARDWPRGRADVVTERKRHPKELLVQSALAKALDVERRVHAPSPSHEHLHGALVRGVLIEVDVCPDILHLTHLRLILPLHQDVLAHRRDAVDMLGGGAVEGQSSVLIDHQDLIGHGLALLGISLTRQK